MMKNKFQIEFNKLSDNEVIRYFDNANMNKDKMFELMTVIIKKRQLYDFKYFEYYERWLYKYVDCWGRCDLYCYRVMNPMIQKYEQLYNNIQKWSKDERIYIKRAALVCFIISNKSFSVNYDLNKILNICDMLKSDEHIHIQKGLGWLLKYAYLAYPKEIEKYLINNANILTRTTFRYALEKMPVNLKERLMKL